MLAPQCGLMHNVTSAMSLQVQRVVALLHHFKYSLTVCVCVCVSQHQRHQVRFLVHDVFLADEGDSDYDSDEQLTLGKHVTLVQCLCTAPVVMFMCLLLK